MCIKITSYIFLFPVYIYVYLPFFVLNKKNPKIFCIYQYYVTFKREYVLLVISACAVFCWHKRPDRFHSIVGTTSCPDKGLYPGSHDSTLSTCPPSTCRSEQLLGWKRRKQQFSIFRRCESLVKC